MELLDKISDGFVSFTSAIERSITKVFGASNEKQIQKLGFVRDKAGNDSVIPGSLLDTINKKEPELQKLTDDELRQTASKLRARLAAGETTDDILPDAFAAVRESGVRYLKMRHYDVQMVGGYFLHQGMIAEMVTGEGKTLVATLPTFLNALVGSVHAITVNDYLALRDMEWMGPIYMGLGLTIGAIQGNMNPQQRQEAYACDITYGTNNEFGFDYLRDNMKPSKDLQVQGPLNFAIVDEIDNILIDEARTPLIISGPAHDDVTKYPKADKIARQLVLNQHFEVREKEHTCHLNEEGVRRAEELAGVDSFYTAGNMEWPHLIDNALRAHHLFKRDVTYVVEGGTIVIVDEFTGRKMEGRQWSDGLHQAVEAKEGVQIKAENQTLATITLQNYFKLYNKLAGMTGTAMTEADEFWKIYQLEVVSIPTNRPMKRVNHPDVIFRTEKEKWDAVVDEVKDVHKSGRPILVGTVSIEKSEVISNKLNKFGIKHNVLNAKHQEREAELIAQAGRKEAVTIATNMAGRGTDIILGGNPENMAWEELKTKHGYTSRLDVAKSDWDALTKEIAQREGMDTEGREVAELGGLHVVGTERHDSRRIDLQLRGRSGRQGDNGSSRFFLSLEDNLMRIFAAEWVKTMLTRIGLKDGEAIESGLVTRRIEGAQKKVEERHFDQRKHLLEYDEVMDEQRKSVYSYRQRVLDGRDCRQLILDMLHEQIQEKVDQYLSADYRWDTIAQWAAHEMRINIEAHSIRDMSREHLEPYLTDQAQRQAEEIIEEQIEEAIPEGADEKEWNWLALSRWFNAQWGLNTNDRELKKVGRDDLQIYMTQRANEAIDRYDYTALDTLLDNELGVRTLCGWLQHQFLLEVPPESILNDPEADVVGIIDDELRRTYREKEINFPVTVGMSRFMAESSQGGERYDREGLNRWANDRFGTNLPVEEFANKSRSEIESKLIAASSEFISDKAKTFRDKVREAFPGIVIDEESNGEVPSDTDQTKVRSLVDWVNENCETSLVANDLLEQSPEEIQQELFQAYNARFRPELSHAEQALVLEVLDTAWKDHLYYMDHLRSGIGLVSYAQKDPKVEYKREGRRAFQSMWGSISQQVGGAIFRIEKESSAFVSSLWQITSTTHETASNDFAEESSGPEPGQTPQTIEPIRNDAPKVGRNDPCPCGSGKKYKKCHGQGG